MQKKNANYKSSHCNYSFALLRLLPATCLSLDPRPPLASPAYSPASSPFLPLPSLLPKRPPSPTNRYGITVTQKIPPSTDCSNAVLPKNVPAQSRDRWWRQAITPWWRHTAITPWWRYTSLVTSVLEASADDVGSNKPLRGPVSDDALIQSRQGSRPGPKRYIRGASRRKRQASRELSPSILLWMWQRNCFSVRKKQTD